MLSRRGRSSAISSEGEQDDMAASESSTNAIRLFASLWPQPDCTQVDASATATLSERDGMSWKWNTGPLGWKDRCSTCRQPLRVQGDSGIVIWTDSKHHHVSRLLDRLAFGSPLAPTATADSVSHWGLMP